MSKEFETNQRLIDRSVGIREQSFILPTDERLSATDIIQIALGSSDGSGGTLEKSISSIKELMATLISGNLPAPSMQALFERAVGLGVSLNQIGLDSQGIGLVEGASQEIYKNLIKDQEEVSIDGKAVLPENPIPKLQARIGGNPMKLVPATFLAGFSYGVINRENRGILVDTLSIPKIGRNIDVEVLPLLRARSWIRQDVQDTRIVDQLFGDTITSLEDLERLENKLKESFSTYMQKRVDKVINGKKLSKTVTRVNNYKKNGIVWCSIWDKEYVDPYENKAREIILRNRQEPNDKYDSNASRIVDMLLKNTGQISEEEKSTERYSLAKQIVANAMDILLRDEPIDIKDQLESCAIYLDIDAQKLKDRITSEVNRYLFSIAGRLGKVELTKNLLKRDLAGGRVPDDIDFLINKFLLDQPAFRINGTPEELIFAWQNFLKRDGAKEKSQIYVPRSLTRPRIIIKGAEATPPIETNIGPVLLRTDIKSSQGPYPYAPEYITTYPTPIIDAFANLVAEYNQTYNSLIDANREWDSDYKYTVGPDGKPINRWVQIDMVGLSPDILKNADNLTTKAATGLLRGRIFEIENNLASYQESLYIFQRNGQPSLFEREFRSSLDAVRASSGKPIALLATTKQKYGAMKQEEFGKDNDKMITDTEVMSLSGFDRFFSPDEFEEYVKENNGDCGYLLYVRSSDPIGKLRNPNMIVDNPLLSNDNLRRIIKANALTFNVDNPEWPDNNPKAITDTKMYLPPMGMAFPIDDVADLDSPEFVDFLKLQGIDPNYIESNRVCIRAKPLLRSYGCYGQERGALKNATFRRNLRKNLSQRGQYIIQPEMEIPTIRTNSGSEYGYMDRIYMYTDGNNYRFMGGCRYLMPVESDEFKSGRIHGNKKTILSELRDY